MLHGMFGAEFEDGLNNSFPRTITRLFWEMLSEAKASASEFGLEKQ